MILLDTNVVSEPYRAVPSGSVRNWLDGQRQQDLFLCTPVLAELWYGVERLPSGGRRDRLERWVQNLEEERFENRVLPVDQAAAHEFGRIVAKRTRMGLPIGPMNALIASIAVCHGAALATRDVPDFEGISLELIDPFAAGSG